MASDPSRFRFCIDRGGTFTDVYAEVPTDGSVDDPTPRVIKLLSEDPANYPNAPREGIRRVLEEATDAFASVSYTHLTLPTKA